MAKPLNAEPDRALLEEALKYSQQSAAIPSPSQELAAVHAKAIQAELGSARTRTRK